MADKRIDELEEATSITSTDLFVLEQASTAKKLTGQTMTSFLLSLANGHGGISTIAKTGSAGTDPVVDTYTITFADTTTTTFQVTNGVKGDQGVQTYVYIKYSTRNPIADSDLTDTPSDWMGICSTTAATAPTAYGSYSWYEIKGAKGDPGNDVTISSTSVQYQAWTSGTQYPTGTWLDNPPAVTPGNYLWTRTIVNYSDGGQTVSYSVSRWGMDGSGAVASVNSQLPDQDGNVTLTASDVGALADSYQPPVTSVNNKTGTVVLGNEDVNAPYGQSMNKSLSSAGWYRVFESVATLTAGTAFAVDFNIGTSYNGTNNSLHKISLLATYENFTFADEVSHSNAVSIDKIRCTRDSAKLYVDIHYSVATENDAWVNFDVRCRSDYQPKITAESLQAVADSPVGETVLKTYTFAADCTPEARVLLWNNWNTNDVNPQTINMDLSGYKFIEVLFDPFADLGKIQCQRCLVGPSSLSAYTATLQYYFLRTDTTGTASVTAVSRDIDVYTSGIVIGNGQMLYNNDKYNDWPGRCRPIQIWGIR